MQHSLMQRKALSRGLCLQTDRFVYLLGALLLLSIPLPWLIAMVTAALFHELCHILCIKCLGENIQGFHIGSGGAVIQTTSLSAWKELACAAAGPLGSFFLLLFARWIPRTAFCAVAQSLFNLLPIYPLDGGRMLRCLVILLGMPKNICYIAEKAAVLVLLLIALYAVFVRHMGILPLVLVCMLLFKKNSLQRSESRGTIGLP